MSKYRGTPNIPSFVQSGMKWFAPAVVIIIVLALAIFPGFHTVPAGHRGVILEFGGKPIGTADEGLYVYFPYWRQEVVDVTVQSMKYETSDILAASADLQVVTTNIAVNYHLDASQVLRIYQTLNLAWEDRVMKPNIEEVVKAISAEFTAEELITKRPLVKQRITEGFVDRIAAYGMVIETVSITDFQFSPAFASAIEAKVTAQQEALREVRNLEKIKVQAQQVVAEAEGTAIAEVTRANGAAEATIIRAEAEAEALRLVKAELTPLLTQLKSVEKWDGVLPDILLSGGGKQEIPFIIDANQLLGENNQEEAGG